MSLTNPPNKLWLRETVRSRKIIFSYPAIFSFNRGSGLEKFEQVEPIIFALQCLRDPIDIRSRKDFISLVEYSINTDKESEMLDTQRAVLWMDWLEWLNDGFVFKQIMEWGLDNRIDQIPIEDTKDILPFNAYSFTIRYLT